MRIIQISDSTSTYLFQGLINLILIEKKKHYVRTILTGTKLSSQFNVEDDSNKRLLLNRAHTSS